MLKQERGAAQTQCHNTRQDRVGIDSYIWEKRRLPRIPSQTRLQYSCGVTREKGQAPTQWRPEARKGLVAYTHGVPECVFACCSPRYRPWPTVVPITQRKEAHRHERQSRSNTSYKGIERWTWARWTRDGSCLVTSGSMTRRVQ